VGNSGIIVLDEPSNGLDPISRKNLQNMIKKHVELRGSSIILTTHDMEEAQYLSDSICFIINGQLPFQQETSQSLIEKYGSGILLTIKIRNEDALE
jgi:ABC-2 type transport system ATP-binding protein